MRARRLLLPVVVNGGGPSSPPPAALAFACAALLAACGGGVRLGGDAAPAPDADAVEDVPDDAGPDATPDAPPDETTADETATEGTDGETTATDFCREVEHDLAVPTDYPTIQAALLAASAGAAICVEPGIYRESIAFPGRPVRLFGVAGAEATLLVADGDRPVVTFERGEGFDTIFEGFTVRQAAVGADGGGLAVHSSSPTLRGLIVRDNYASHDGGGILLEASDASLIDLEVTGNGAGDEGGGIWISGGAPTLLRVRLQGNFADGDGGGLRLVDTRVTLEAVSLVENGSGSAGGGISATNASPTLRRVRFSDNFTDYLGGGMALDGLMAPPVVLERVVFERNRAGDEGGGMGVYGGNATLSGVTFLDNEASNGGGLRVHGARLEGDGVLLVGNRALGQGGGGDVDDGHLDLVHLLVAGNSASGGAGLHVDDTDGRLAVAVFAGNMSEGGGAALDASGGGLTIEQASIVGNSATGSDGDGGTLQLKGAAVLRGVVVADHGGPTSAIVVETWYGTPSFSHCAFWNLGAAPFAGMPDPTGTGGNLAGDPLFLDVGDPDPSAWDLHLGSGSALVDAGPSAPLADPDGSPADLGAYGGPDAAGWDLDGDGSPAWWQPGPYDSAAYPAEGWDCDDRDPLVGSSSGC